MIIIFIHSVNYSSTKSLTLILHTHLQPLCASKCQKSERARVGTQEWNREKTENHSDRQNEKASERKEERMRRGY